MKIISKYHDYYDSVIAYGQDPKTIYIRNVEEFENGTNEYELLLSNNEIWNHSNLLPPISLGPYTSFVCERTFLVLFCEKLYPCIVFRPPLKRDALVYPKGRRRYCYTKEEAVECLSKYPETKEQKKYRHYGFPKIDPFSDKGLELLFDIPEKVGYDIHQETKIPSFLIEKERIRYTRTARGRDNCGVVFNPILKDIHFVKIFDPFQAFQELSMFISGILGGSSPAMIEIGNDIRLQKHGFDLKTSFRKRSQNQGKERDENT